MESRYVYRQGDSTPLFEVGVDYYILDFSYPREILLHVEKIAAGLTILDHHKTAAESLLGLNFALFDQTKSGAVLAWEYWHPDEPIPDLLKYVQDRDLWQKWQKLLPQTEEVHRGLQSFIQDFEVWDALCNFEDYPAFAAQIGKPLYQAHLERLEELAFTARWINLAGHKVLATNTSNLSLVSDALNLICRWNQKTPFAANFHDYGNIRKWELRSEGSFDVSAIAKQFGGGGHLNAAGFQEIIG